MIRIRTIFLILCTSVAPLSTACGGAILTIPPFPDTRFDSTGSDSSANSSGHRPLDTLLYDAEALFVDAWDLIKLPGSWGSRDLVSAGVLAGAISATIAADRSVHGEIMSWKGSDGDQLVDATDYLGHNSVGLISAGALYLPGLVLDLPWLRLAGRHLAQTLIYSAGLGSLLKGGLGRSRPFNGDGPYSFRGPWQYDNAWMSLPSGHTIVAFSIASTLSASIDRTWATLLLYGGATLTALGRVYQNQHWGSDVLIAAIVTSAIGHGVVSLAERSAPPVELSGETSINSPQIYFLLSPTPGRLRTGVSVCW
jgi:membrane-associated phospholipid phosphatase